MCVANDDEFHAPCLWLYLQYIIIPIYTLHNCLYIYLFCILKSEWESDNEGAAVLTIVLLKNLSENLHI